MSSLTTHEWCTIFWSKTSLKCVLNHIRFVLIYIIAPSMKIILQALLTLGSSWFSFRIKKKNNRQTHPNRYLTGTPGKQFWGIHIKNKFELTTSSFLRSVKKEYFDWLLLYMYDIIDGVRRALVSANASQGFPSASVVAHTFLWCNRSYASQEL